MSSSLEDRIRLLTDRAIAANTETELETILPELKTAIGDHISYVRAVVVETIPEAFVLWDSENAGVTFVYNKFNSPVVANGRLYVPTYDERVDVYVLA